ncbi:hypothetical protein NST83_16685 [Paenibacillus sp. FSL R10-2782]|uniref:hypothetical protein n=1 Tax=Paenibacillus sp. FSL R10-2782 TaxID=2954661 RepID=UPI003158203E
MKKVLLCLCVAGVVLSGCTTSKSGTTSTESATSSNASGGSDSSTVHETVATENKGYQGKISFRNVGWGMSKEQVKASEDMKVEEEDQESIAYYSKILGLESGLMYFFVDDQLVRAGYLVTEKHTNKNDYIENYNDLKKSLTEKYGKPSSDDTLWKGELYKDTPSQWGMAVATGELHYQAAWETEDTEILLDLQGDNFEPQLSLLYDSKELQHLSEQQKDQELKKNL